MNVNQIWIGKLGNMRKEDLACMDTVRRWCKQFGHKYKLWLSEGVKDLLERNNLPFREDCHPVTITDIARILILDQEEGLYFDNDMEVRQPEKWEEYISAFPKDKFGYQKNDIHTHWWYCCGALFSSPDNPMFVKIVAMAKEYYPEMKSDGSNIEEQSRLLLERFAQEREIFCQGFDTRALQFYSKSSYVTHRNSHLRNDDEMSYAEKNRALHVQ